MVIHFIFIIILAAFKLIGIHSFDLIFINFRFILHFPLELRFCGAPKVGSWVLYYLSILHIIIEIPKTIMTFKLHQVYETVFEAV